MGEPTSDSDLGRACAVGQVAAEITVPLQGTVLVRRLRRPVVSESGIQGAPSGAAPSSKRPLIVRSGYTPISRIRSVVPGGNRRTQALPDACKPVTPITGSLPPFGTRPSLLARTQPTYGRRRSCRPPARLRGVQAAACTLHVSDTSIDCRGMRPLPASRRERPTRACFINAGPTGR